MQIYFSKRDIKTKFKMESPQNLNEKAWLRAQPAGLFSSSALKNINKCCFYVLQNLILLLQGEKNFFGCIQRETAFTFEMLFSLLSVLQILLSVYQCSAVILARPISHSRLTIDFKQLLLVYILETSEILYKCYWDSKKTLSGLAGFGNVKL